MVEPGLSSGGGSTCRTFQGAAQVISGAGLVDNEWKNGGNPKGEAKK